MHDLEEVNSAIEKNKTAKGAGEVQARALERSRARLPEKTELNRRLKMVRSSSLVLLTRKVLCSLLSHFPLIAAFGRKTVQRVQG